MTPIDRVIERSSLGAREARERRRSVDRAAATRIVAAARDKSPKSWGDERTSAPTPGRGRSNPT